MFWNVALSMCVHVNPHATVSWQPCPPSLSHQVDTLRHVISQTAGYSEALGGNTMYSPHGLNVSVSASSSSRYHSGDSGYTLNRPCPNWIHSTVNIWHIMVVVLAQRENTPHCCQLSDKSDILGKWIALIDFISWPVIHLLFLEKRFECYLKGLMEI